MVTALLIALVLLDLALIAAVFFINRKQEAQGEMVSELTEERRAITELRQAVTEELDAAQARIRTLVDKVSVTAAEAELEVRNGSSALKTEVETLVAELGPKFEAPMRELTKKQHYIETLLKQLEQQRIVIQKVIARGEKLAKVFDDKVSFEDVLQEIEDKKYADARFMISQGVPPLKVARELGISEQEVKLLGGI